MRVEISKINISMPMLKQITEIDEFKGSWNAGVVTRSEQFKQMKKVSTIESVGSSNRIEGNCLSNSEVETVLKNLGKQFFKNRDEEEVAGYAELLNTIYENYSIIPLNENYVKQLHGILLNKVSKDVHHCGEYKKISNAVAAFDSDGHEIGIIFDTATPFDTPRMMKDLIEWANEAFEECFFHPLIVIGVFIVHFLAIHPFQDGNGRLSRALTTLLLLKAGYSYVPYSSLESIIEASKSSYYMALRYTQKHIWDEQVDYEPWLSFFLMSLYKQKRHLEDKVKLIEEYADLSNRALAVLKLFDENEKLTSQEVVQKTGFNIETVRKILQKLLGRGDIKKYGTTKTRSYQKNKNRNHERMPK